MNRKLLEYRYQGKSVPEFVTMTMLALSGERMVGCEGKRDYDLCASCRIGKACFMRIFYIFGGGQV